MLRSLARLKDMRRQYGLAATCGWLAARLAQRTLKFDLSRMVLLDIDRLSAIEVDPEFTFRFLAADEVAELTADPGYALAAEFAERAAGAVDLCFAAIDREGIVAHYGWYAFGDIDGADHMGVPMQLADDAAYFYNAFTHPACRGRRLHGMAMAAAVSELRVRGIRRIVSTVGATNYPSLRSFYRLGFVDIGRLWTIGRGRVRWSLKPKAAELAGIRFGGATVAQPC